MARDPHPFYVPRSGITADGIVTFPEEEARHILHVIRMRSGDECRVVDGVGGIYSVRLVQNGEHLRGTVLEEKRCPPSPTFLELGFPMLRVRSRTEWLLEKAVEVGVDSLVPLLWTRGIQHRFEGVRGRWERILREAMKQSQRAWLPTLFEPQGACDAPPDRTVILADPEGPETLPGLDEGVSVRLLIGPEGGPSREERERLVAGGAAIWSLGPTRLRSETAAVVASHRLAGALRAIEVRGV